VPHMPHRAPAAERIVLSRCRRESHNVRKRHRGASREGSRDGESERSTTTTLRFEKETRRKCVAGRLSRREAARRSDRHRVALMVCSGKVTRRRTHKDCEGELGCIEAEDASLVRDARFGGFLNADIAECVIPVDADICTIDLDFIVEPDVFPNPAGVKGLGEVAMVGVAKAM
jgi:hypothetical protein